MEELEMGSPMHYCKFDLKLPNESTNDAPHKMNNNMYLGYRRGSIGVMSSLTGDTGSYRNIALEDMLHEDQCDRLKTIETLQETNLYSSQESESIQNHDKPATKSVKESSLSSDGKNRHPERRKFNSDYSLKTHPECKTNELNLSSLSLPIMGSTRSNLRRDDHIFSSSLHETLKIDNDDPRNKNLVRSSIFSSSSSPYDDIVSPSIGRAQRVKEEEEEHISRAMFQSLVERKNSKSIVQGELQQREEEELQRAITESIFEHERTSSSLIIAGQREEEQEKELQHVLCKSIAEHELQMSIQRAEVDQLQAAMTHSLEDHKLRLQQNLEYQNLGCDDEDGVTRLAIHESLMDSVAQPLGKRKEEEEELLKIAMALSLADTGRADELNLPDQNYLPILGGGAERLQNADNNVYEFGFDDLARREGIVSLSFQDHCDVAKIDCIPKSVYINVIGAGVEALNGRYHPAGTHDGVGMYRLELDAGDGNNVRNNMCIMSTSFCLYRCALRDGIRCWFISMVPYGKSPGSSIDKIYYVALGNLPISNEINNSFHHKFNEYGFPPEVGWEPRHFGRYPSPSIKIVVEDKDEPMYSTSRTCSNSEQLSSEYREDRKHVSMDKNRKKILVDCAGIAEVNGFYFEDQVSLPSHCNYYDKNRIIISYSKKVVWNGHLVKMVIHHNQTLEKSNMGDLLAEGQRWFISAILGDNEPGSNTDIDLYTAIVQPKKYFTTEGELLHLPPQNKWSVTVFGKGPAPYLKPYIEGVPLSMYYKSIKEPNKSMLSLIPQCVPTEPSNEYIINNHDQEGIIKEQSRNPVLYRNNQIELSNLPNSHSILPSKLLRGVAKCIVCRARPVTHVLVPCGHPCLCDECVSPLVLNSLNGQCPIGRCKVDSVLRFYGTLMEEK